MLDHDREAAAKLRLEADGLLEPGPRGPVPSRRWRAALMRAAARLVATPDAPEDLRVPVAMALVEHYGDAAGDDELEAMVVVMAEVTAAETPKRPVPLASPTP